MDRRSFLKYLGLTAAAGTMVAVVPKLIFDLAANKRKYPSAFEERWGSAAVFKERLYICKGYEEAAYEEVLIYGKDPFIYQHTDKIIEVPKLWPRRFNLLPDGTMKEVFPLL